MSQDSDIDKRAGRAGRVHLGSLEVNRLGYGAMQMAEMSLRGLGENVAAVDVTLSDDECAQLSDAA